MCKEIIYFCAELLNYWSMTFFGLKLFAKVYQINRDKKKSVENIIFTFLTLPMAMISAGNYYYVHYSSILTHFIVICLSDVSSNPHLTMNSARPGILSYSCLTLNTCSIACTYSKVLSKC